MKRAIFFILLLTVIHFSSYAQVHVRGYYRANGTYVAPHERTMPNNTVTDNYSFPGNNNPNKENELNGASPYGNYVNFPEYYLASEGAKVRLNDKNKIFVLKDEVNLRTGPSLENEILVSLNYRETLWFIEKIDSHWSKVLCKYFDGPLSYGSSRYVIGYVSNSYLSFVQPEAKNYFYYQGHKVESYPISSGITYDFSRSDKVERYLRAKYALTTKELTPYEEAVNKIESLR